MNQSYEFDPRELNEAAFLALTAAGWAPARTVDVSDWVRMLRSEQYAVGAIEVEFIRSFGGLQVLFARSNGTGMDKFLVDPQEASDGIYRSSVSHYEACVGQVLTPIGQAYTRHMTVMVDGGGSLWGGYDNALVRFGRSTVESLNVLLADLPCVARHDCR